MRCFGVLGCFRGDPANGGQVLLIVVMRTFIIVATISAVAAVIDDFLGILPLLVPRGGHEVQTPLEVISPSRLEYDHFGKLRKTIFNARADKQKGGYRRKSFEDIS